MDEDMALESVLYPWLDDESMADTETEPEDDEPDEELLQEWMETGVACATDGCRVEPDGHCPHGKPSWLLELGLI